MGKITMVKILDEQYTVVKTRRSIKFEGGGKRNNYPGNCDQNSKRRKNYRRRGSSNT